MHASSEGGSLYITVPSWPSYILHAMPAVTPYSTGGGFFKFWKVISGSLFCSMGGGSQVELSTAGMICVWTNELCHTWMLRESGRTVNFSPNYPKIWINRWRTNELLLYTTFVLHECIHSVILLRESTQCYIECPKKSGRGIKKEKHVSPGQWNQLYITASCVYHPKLFFFHCT